MKTPRAKIPHPRANELRPCVIIWEDAARSNFDGALTDIPTFTTTNHTIGFLASPRPSKRIRREVKLVQEISPDENTVRWPLGIPPGMIRDILMGADLVRYVVERSELDSAVRVRLLDALDSEL